MKKKKSVLICALLSLASYLLVAALSERPFWDTRVPPGKEKRAALAIRDHVTPFQQWGTKAFTVGYLRRYYDASWYFTQHQKGDKKREFTTCLDAALEDYEIVDLYLLAHTNHYIKWVASLPEEKRQRIRFVYNTGCHNLPQGKRWLKLGADAYVGHPGKSSSAVFYVFFLRRWCRGASIDEAMTASNQHIKRVFQSYGPWRKAEESVAWLMEQTRASANGNAALRIDGSQP